jgi:DNA polymerase I-like protein with 3'-5' exonuclease and polymerase domains
MPRIIRPRATRLNPDQIPLITPDSDWTPPTELPDLRRAGEIAVDTETRDLGLLRGVGPGWAFGSGYVAGVGVAWRQGADIGRMYVPIRHPETENFDKDRVAEWLRDLFATCSVVFFNAGYDIGWLQTDLGVLPPPKIDDASCAAFMVDENRLDNSLDATCRWRGVEGKDKAALIEAANVYGFSANDAVANIARLPARYAGIYGQQDPVSTLLLMDSLRPEMEEQRLTEAYRTEMRLVPLIHQMRRTGIRVNVDQAAKLRKWLHARRDAALAELTSRLKMPVGMEEIRSSRWLISVFDIEKVPYNMKGEEGSAKASFEADWMRAAEHWLPLMIAEAKQCHEAAEKFVKAYIMDFTHRGRVHASINQFRTEEGGTRSQRLSYADPPLQQAPSRPDPIESWKLTGEIATAYRSMFEPEEGTLWFSPDYSQQEYRHIVNDAEEAGCARAVEAADMYRNDPKTDFHNLVVQMTGLTRRRAKDCNFAKAFGAGVRKFATMIGAEFEEAESIMKQYDTKLPFVREFGQRCEKAAQERGYIRMIDGARAHFDMWEAAWLDKGEWQRGMSEHRPMGPTHRADAEARAADENHPWFNKRIKRSHTHKAMNRRIQGSAARQMKMAMAQCWEEGLVPMLQMHDELSFSMTDPDKGARVVEIMRTVYQCGVPFLVDAEWGTNWGNAKHSHAEAAALAAPNIALTLKQSGRPAPAHIKGKPAPATRSGSKKR